MNEPSVIQSQQAKWMEVIIVWLGIFTLTRAGLSLSNSLQYSRSTPEIISSGIGIGILLLISMILLAKNLALTSWIFNTPTHTPMRKTSREKSLGWLTIGIFTFGFLCLVHTIPKMCFVLGGQLSLWFNPNREALGITEEKMQFYISIFSLNHFPPLVMGLFLTFFSHSLEKWIRSLQERWGSLKTKPPQ